MLPNRIRTRVPFCCLLLAITVTRLLADDVHSLLHQSSDGATLRDITLGSSGFVAVGDRGRILFSLDGSSWNRRETGPTDSFSSVAHLNGRYVAVTTEGRIFSSTDTERWSLVYSGIIPLRRVAVSTYVSYALGRVGSEFLAVGDRGTLLRSVDGVTWLAETSPTIAALHAILDTIGSFTGSFAFGAGGTWLIRREAWETWDSGSDANFTHAVKNHSARWFSSGGASNGDEDEFFAVGDYEARRLRRRRIGGPTQDFSSVPATSPSSRPITCLLASDTVTQPSPSTIYPNSQIFYPRELLAVDASAAVFIATGQLVSSGNTARIERTWREHGALSRRVFGGVADLTRECFFLVGENESVFRVLFPPRPSTPQPPPATSTLPVISTQPRDQTRIAGEPLTLSVTATGSPPLAFQWQRNGVAIPGATAATFLIPSLQLSDAATYTVAVTNSAGTVITAPAVVDVLPANPGRLANLSVRGQTGPAAPLIVGFIVQGGAPGLALPLLTRASGPALRPLGVNATLPDPVLNLFDGPRLIASNDNWPSAETAPLAAAVGAFAFPPASRDSALASDLTASAYTSHVVDASGGSGVALLEIFARDAPFSYSRPRLSNLSARGNVGSGDATLTVGFVVQGDNPVTLLLRAIGPTLAQFGVGAPLRDPRLRLLRDTTVLAENDNWSDLSSRLTPAAAFVGAFALPPASLDSALVTTLPAGSYTLQVTGETPAATGNVLIELYQLPELLSSLPSAAPPTTPRTASATPPRE